MYKDDEFNFTPEEIAQSGIGLRLNNQSSDDQVLSLQDIANRLGVSLSQRRIPNESGMRFAALMQDLSNVEAGRPTGAQIELDQRISSGQLDPENIRLNKIANILKAQKDMYEAQYMPEDRQFLRQQRKAQAEQQTAQAEKIRYDMEKSKKAAMASPGAYAKNLEFLADAYEQSGNPAYAKLAQTMRNKAQYVQSLNPDDFAIFKEQDKDLSQLPKDLASFGQKDASQEALNAYRMAMLGMSGQRASLKLGEDERKRQDLLDERAIEGFGFKPGKRPTSNDYKKVSDSKETWLNMTEIADKLKDSIKNSGTSITGWTKQGATMAQDYKTLFDNIRKLADLGVLNSQDIVYANDQLPNPVGIEGTLKEKGSPGYFAEVLDNLKYRATVGLANSANSRGYDDTEFRKTFNLPETGKYGTTGEKQQKTTKTIVKKQYSPSMNKTKFIYSDGSEDIVDGKQ